MGHKMDCGLRLMLVMAFALGAGPAAPTGDATAVAKDAAATKALLLGAKRVTLHWVESKNGGTFAAPEVDSVITVKGEVRADKGTDMASIEGRVTRVTKDGFELDGTVVTKVSFVGDGADCERKGKLTFKTKAGRRYWRMQQIHNPCDKEGNLVDYVDVYFD